MVTVLTMLRKGLLIVVEGPSRAARAEVADRLASLREAVEERVVRVPAPDADPAFVQGLDSLQAATGVPAPFSAEVVATVRAALRDHQVTELVLPSLDAGHTVLVDGYWWSASVAASLAGKDRTYREQVAKLEVCSWRKLQPDVVLLVVPQFDDAELAAIGGKCVARFEHLARQESMSVLVRGVFRDCHPDALQAALRAIAPAHNAPPEQIGLFNAIPATAERAPNLTVPTGLSPAATGPVIAARRELPQPSPVYDTYWQFAVRRQHIFMTRLRGEQPPWTTDPILLQHKFTNVYRASDRVSQYLIRHVIYNGARRDADDTVFRILLFKIFNKIETWDLLERQIGDISWKTYDFRRYDGVLCRAFAEGTRIYSAAYIMPSVPLFGHERKHQNHLKLLERMMHEGLPQSIEKVRTLRDLFLLLRNNPGIGDFLAYQFAIDINYSDVVDFDESTFVMPGPGARDGIKKCFPDAGALSEAEIIERVTERQDFEFDRLGLHFERLGHRELKLIDCQNIFCEVDKYARLRHPEIKGISGRTRIKQVYRTNAQPIRYSYPEKWGINAAIDAIASGAARPPASVLPMTRPTDPAEEQLGLMLGGTRGL